MHMAKTERSFDRLISLSLGLFMVLGTCTLL